MPKCSKFLRLGTVSHFNYHPSRLEPHCDFNVLSLMTHDSEFLFISLKFSSVQLLSRVRLFVTPWTAARQASLPITNSQSLLKLMSTESVMPSSHLILYVYYILATVQLKAKYLNKCLLFGT